MEEEEETRASSRERESPLVRRVTHSITGDEGADVERDPLFSSNEVVLSWSGSGPASSAARREATNFCVLRSTRRSSASVWDSNRKKSKRLKKYKKKRDEF